MKTQRTVDSFTVNMSREHAAHGAPPPGLGSWIAPVAQAVAASGSLSSQDRAFIALQNAYRPHGGLSRLSGLAAGKRSRSDKQDNDVAGLVETGMLFGFQWYADLWIPMFQLDLPSMTLAAGPQRAVAELGYSFDGWALASWFVQPNCWLANRSPIECMDSDLPDVLEAARADRFVTMG